jgi:hypothetical protein
LSETTNQTPEPVPPPTPTPVPSEPIPDRDSASDPAADVASSSPAGGEGAQSAQPPPQQDWRDKRIATLTRRLREFQENQARIPAADQPRPQPPSPDQFSQQQVEARARQLAEIQDFNRRCDETALAGRGQFGEAEFNGRINNLQKLVDHSDPVSVNAYNSMLIAAIDTGLGPKVLFELGADLNEAQRILALQPTRMAVELTKRSLTERPDVSAAPKPITPVSSRGSHQAIEPDDADRSDHLSTAEWMRRREAQINARRQSR